MNINQQIYDITGAAMAVHRELKNGLLEPVYQEALEIEFQLRNIPYDREKVQEIFYKGQKLEKFYKMDFFCYNNIVVELKATEELLPEHRFQLFNYMRLSKCQYGLLINFGESSLKSEPYYWDSSENRCHLLKKVGENLF